ncbi:MAG: hypothetical protein ACK4NE_07545 [Albidovulum sp.]
MDIMALASLGVLLALVGAHLWYDRWCDRNGVPRPSGSASMDGLSASDGDGGD